MRTHHRLFCLSLLLIAALAYFPHHAAAREKPATGPLTPQQAVKQFRLPPGYRIELVASEPQIESPVAMAFDEDGRIWVVEMGDYPNGPAKGQKPAGRIRILEDKDGDGFFETATTWAEHLLFANGLFLWKNGAIVTMSPKIVHLSDPDGRGKAEKIVPLYEGFAEQNPQLRVSHPILGLDGWIYCANGLRGGKVTRAASRERERPEKVVDLSGMDFRFDPLKQERYEAISGLGQYGNTFDDWGRRFVCDNRHHLRHIVIENRYLQRNPYLAAPAVVEDVSELEDGPLYSGGRVYPISKNWTTSTLHEGRFTAACGVFVYRGDLLDSLRGHAFTCEPTGNLVHEEVLTLHGATFKSKPARDKVEFVATTDDWFRPVFLTHGPDGAMYIVDMYRAVIEHPDFMPPELQKRPDLTLGKDKGRIWRIVPEKRNDVTLRINLKRATTKQLVGFLRDPNAWHRTTAQRLLLERQDKTTVDELKRLFLKTASDGKRTTDGLARVHAAWLLANFGALENSVMLSLMNDKNPRVREHGVRLAESRLSKSADLQKRVLELSADADAQVRFQVALSLGEWDDDAKIDPLLKIALAGDKWTRLAVASSAAERTGKLLCAELGAPFSDRNEGRSLLFEELATIVGARKDANEISQVLDEMLLTHPGYFALIVCGLGDGMARRGTHFDTFLDSLPAKHKRLVAPVRKFYAAVELFAVSRDGSAEDRLELARLLAHVDWATAKRVGAELLDDNAPPKIRELVTPELRQTAVRSLSAHASPEVAAVLMKSWRTSTPPLRRVVTEAMFRTPQRLNVLLDEIEAKRVKPGDLDSLRTRQLVNHADAKIRERGGKLLKDNLPADRKEVLARYQQALKIEGKAERGREIFKKNCASCHRVAGVGIDVGPDIADSRTRTLEALLVDILNPNQAIDNNYVNYLATTKNGKSLSGIITTETATSVTLRRAEGQSDVVLRQDIDTIESSGVSLMPEGLEKAISVADMADLLLFLKNWRYLDGAVPLK